MGIEEWRVIPEFEEYEVSSYGRVRHGQKILKGLDNGTGYKKLNLVNGNNKKRFYVHRLVAMAFVPNPINKPCVNHIDNNRENNRADNLEWCTHKENYDWMARQGRNKRTKEWLEKLHKTQSKDYKAVIGINIKTGKKIYFKSLNSVRKKGFNPPCVCRCCKGIGKTHAGYIWKYVEELEWAEQKA